MSNHIPSSYKIIAGNAAGIKVTIPPALEDSYATLKQLAESGNHWARICIANIHSLASGHFKNNIFVQSDDYGKFPEFSMILPGCLIQIRKRSNSDYLIFNVKSNSNYQSLQENFKKPGLFRVEKNNRELIPKFVADGNVLPEKNRVVTISDQYDTPEDAAKDSSRAASKSPMSQYASRDGFDMHFTPGEAKIGGLKRLDQARNADSCPEIRESAMLLAKTMHAARGVSGVNWISQGGGSGVLTQAMSILKDRRVDFAEAKHYVFFSDLTTNLVKAEEFARDIGMKFERSTKSIDYTSIQSIAGSGMGGAYAAAYYRYRQDPEKYTALKMGHDMYKESAPIRFVTSTATKHLGITTATVALALGCSPTAIGLAGGIAAAAAFGGKTAAFGLNKFAPDLFDKIKSKF